MQNTLQTPKNLKEPYFKLETNLDPSNLVQASELLLNCLSPKLKQSFRLVITLSEEKASFKLCLDPSLWFDVYLQTVTDFAEAVNIARQYVTTTRLNISPEEEAPFIIDYKETVKDKAFIICPYASTCRNGSNCEKDHPKIYCDGKVITRDGRTSKCNFYFTTKLVIDELSNDKYVVMLRREPFRELLLIPHPNFQAKNCGHYNNETLVQQETFWKELLNKQQTLNFHSIAINYGAWETGQSQNKYAQECHAHRLSWTKLFTTELEEKRLRSAEHQLMLKAISNITSTMNENTKALIKEMSSVKENNNENTRAIIEAM
ncbi:2622_t:CDS:2 [Funneliformis geosporum]|uniref:2622_t:CDS:1 n=1 Tax=Funneliformis geosporum TaxID=1117311 RepID=A0A9W4WUZ3_9GLOM|nr:2622_t:CDS:2 [Funneliformis geosporum]